MKEQEVRGKEHGKKKATAALLVAVLVFSDQAAKYLFSRSERYYCNAGGPWGLPADNGVLVAVTAVILAVVPYLFWKSRGALSGISFALILAGGFSNLFDRIVFGCVRDFALISWFPAFNLADAFLTIGVGLFLLPFFLNKK